MTKRYIKRFQILLFCAAAGLGLLLTAAQAKADTGVPYVERSWNGTSVVSADETHDAEPVPTDGGMTSGWYYLNSNVTVNGRVASITGDVSLILGDGYTLDVKGLYVPADSTLTIYGQSDGDGAGRFISHPDGGAGIGGYSGHDNGNIVIHGGIIEAKGGEHCAGIGSNDGRTGGAITIYGGAITAIGGSDGAGIGGGRNCSGGEITICGGNITANGPTDSDCCENGAGIGGGEGGAGGTINIYGGTVNTYSRDGAGIGGGDNGAGGTITIRGGTITATKVNQGQGARIGGGCDAAPGTITIHDGTITTVGGSGAGIGGGKGNTSGGSVTINGGVISAGGSYGIGSGENGSDVAITLNYTNATRDTIRITASSFNGAVTLSQPFAKYAGNSEQYIANLFMPGEISDNSQLAGGTLKAWDGRVTSWQMLQMAINDAPDGATIMLDENITAVYSQDVALHVGSGKNLTIDLGGWTINRGLTDKDPLADGYVILNEGTLTITDRYGIGIITGGNCSGAGGGIYNKGTLTFKDGNITGNSAATWGGGIYLPDNTGAVLNLEGGSVNGNTCGSNGGGVHVSGTTSLSISKRPVVTGNTKNGASNNIYLASGAVMLVTGSLTSSANLGVSMAGSAGYITRGYGVYNGLTDPDAFFHADQEGYGILPDIGEVKLDAVQNHVPYIRCSWNGTTVATETAYADKVRSLPQDGGMTEGWYYLDSSVTVDGRISLTRDTNFILGDGCTLDVKGIYIPQGSTLTIYAQSSGENAGKLISRPSGGAAIGGYSGHDNGNIVIHGGVIEARGADHCAGIGTNDGRTGGAITIYGGTVTAKGGSDGAGIGGGRNREGGTITIYGGTFTVKSGKNGAGIGGGNGGNGGTITIWGGTFTINEDPEEDGAAIGGGDEGNGGHITINGGRFTLYSRDGACIGGGDDGEGGTITINGGTITCHDEGTAQGARIGGGDSCDGGSITINGGLVTVYHRDGAGIGGGEGGDGGTIRITGGTVFTQPKGKGNGAGIGGGNHSGDGGTITITNGEVHAKSEHGAGIGGGRSKENQFGDDPPSGDGGMITINGGHVTASSRWGFGIGAGWDFYTTAEGNHLLSPDPYGAWIGDAGTITINGGTVYAYGGTSGIGGKGGTVTITNGNVHVYGYITKGTGHGIYMDSSSSRVYIKGGTVWANGYGKKGNDNWVGISTECSQVEITGGTVYATSEYGAAIGGINNDMHGSLLISGANTEVHASSGGYAGIGGKGSSDGDWTFGKEAKIEVTSGKIPDYAVPINHEGSRIKAGDSEETATWLPAEEKETAHTVYKYRLIETCTHEDEHVIDGRCTLCGWQSGYYFVTYELYEDRILEIRQVQANGTAAAPESVPARAGFVFQNKWYLVTDAGTPADEPYDFSTPVTKDITLRAGWKHEHNGIEFQPWLSGDSLPTEAGNYYLTQNVALDSPWTWSGGTLNLCLHGYRVTGVHGSEDDTITIVGGQVNLYDEQGGALDQTYDCWGEVVHLSGGGFTMHGGTITGGGNLRMAGVRVTGGAFRMTGGTITNRYNGVLVDGGTFTVSGNVTVAGKNSGIYLNKNNSVITIDGALHEDSRIGVAAANLENVITTGLPGNGSAANFYSDVAGYAVDLNADGEMILYPLNTVVIIFESGSNYARGEMPMQLVETGSMFTLPACGYTVPGMDFVEWIVQIGKDESTAHQPGDRITVTAETYVTAVWQLIPFPAPDFVIPVGTTAIEANAFEGVAATTVVIPVNCTSIGSQAFKDCTNLSRIRIPAGCELGTAVFDGCALVHVFGVPDSDAERYCDEYDNCVFVDETQN